MEHDGLTGFPAVLNVVANLMIVGGYVLVPFTVLRYMPLTYRVRVAGTLFFVPCALSHLAMAFGFQHSLWMVVNHVVQAVAVVWFVLSFWVLLRTALVRAEARRERQP